MGSPSVENVQPVRWAMTTQSSPMPTPRTEGVPTLRETSAIAQREGSLVPSSCVTWSECSFHEVEAFSQLESGANGLAIVFGDAEKAVDPIVAFGIFDAAGAHQRSVHGCAVGKISMQST